MCGCAHLRSCRTQPAAPRDHPASTLLLLSASCPQYIPIITSVFALRCALAAGGHIPAVYPQVHGTHLITMRHYQRLRPVLYSRLARETTYSLALRAVNAGLMFLVTVVLARLLGAAGYGIYAYAYAVVTIVGIPLQSGLPELTLRETSRGLAQSQPCLVRGVWEWSAKVGIISSLLIVLLIGPVLIVWQGGFRSISGEVMAWALLLVPIMALGNLCAAALRGLHRVVIGQLPELALRPGLMLLFVGALAVMRGELSPPQVMALHVSASFLTLAIGICLLWSHVPKTLRCAKPVLDTHRWLFSTMTFALISGLALLNNQASTVILGVFDTSASVGRFRVASQVAGLASFGLQATNMVVAPRIADLWARGEKPRLQSLVTRSAQVVVGLSLVIATLFAVAGRPFFRLLFGQDFEGAFIPLLILLVGQVANSAAGPVGYLLNMTGYERETIVGMGVGVGLNLILSLTLVPTWGIVGASIASAASIAVWNSLLWWRVRQRLGIISLPFRVVQSTGTEKITYTG